MTEGGGQEKRRSNQRVRNVSRDGSALGDRFVPCHGELARRINTQKGVFRTNQCTGNRLRYLSGRVTKRYHLRELAPRYKLESAAREMCSERRCSTTGSTTSMLELLMTSAEDKQHTPLPHPSLFSCRSVAPESHFLNPGCWCWWQVATCLFRTTAEKFAGRGQPLSCSENTRR